MRAIQHLIFFYFLILAGCLPMSKNSVEINIKNNSNINKTASITNVSISNNQLIISGANLNTITDVKIQGGATETFTIESQSASQIVANGLHSLNLGLGSLFDLVLSSAQGAATFPINFSLCDATLGGKSFNCAITPNDKEVLSYDAISGKWKPRAVNGLSFQGAWDASTPEPASTTSGDYYIVSVASGGYLVGDWIVFNGTTYDQISNATSVTNVFGRSGVITATKGDYVLNKMGDVDLTTIPPVSGNFLKYNGTNWVPGTVVSTESDPTVSAFAKAALPTCAAGEVLKGNGTSLSCVNETFSGTANRVVATDGAGALAVTAITDTVLGYLSGATSNIQVQIDSKLAAASFVDWSTAGVQTIDPTRLNLPTCAAGEVLKSNGSAFSCVTDNAGGGAYSGATDRAVITDGSGALSTSAVTNTELGYVSGVTGAIQTQLNAKQATIDKTTTQAVSAIRIYGANATNYVELNAATLTGNRLLSFPDSNGSSGNVLSTNGSGVLSWAAPSGGSLTDSTVTYAKLNLTDGDIPQAKVNGLVTALAGKEPAITAGTTAQYLRGDKSLSTFASDVLATVLTGLTTATNAVITATDSALSAFGKLQKQITDLDSLKLNKTGGTLSVGTISGVPTPTNADDVANKGYVDGFGQWVKSSSDIYYSSGSVGIGTTSPKSKLDVNGSIRLSDDSTVCSATIAGAIRYNSASNEVENCDGTNWITSSFGTTAKIPANTVLLMNACPSGWTNNGLVATTGMGQATCNGTACNMCQSPATVSSLPASSIILMEMCPRSWTSLGVAPGQQLAGLTNYGYASCQSPASATGLPYGARLIATACPSNWTDLGVGTGQVSATCGAISCRVCEVPSTNVLNTRSLDAGTGGTTGNGPPILIKAGAGGTTSGNGGSVTINAGVATTEGFGGSVSVTAGNAVTASSVAHTGGNITLTAGNSVGGSLPGTLSLLPGSALIGGQLVYGDTIANPNGGSFAIGENGTPVASLHVKNNLLVSPATISASSGNYDFTTSTAITLIAGDVVVPTSHVSEKKVIGTTATASTSFWATKTFGSSISGDTLNIYHPMLQLFDDSGHAKVTVQGYTGNVGINNPAPLNALDVAGGVSIGSYGGNVAPTNGLMVSGNVGIGTMLPNDKLDIASGNVRMTDDFYLRWGGNTTGISGNNASNSLTFATNNVTRMQIDSSGNVGINGTNASYTMYVNGSVAGTSAYNNLSDQRLKKEITRIPSSLDKLSELNGVYYSWRKDEHPELKLSDRREMGVIAQQVEKVFPEAVTTAINGIKSVAYSMLIAPIIESLKDVKNWLLDHDKKIAENNRKIASLDQKNADLKEQNLVIENKLNKIEKENQEFKDALCSINPKAKICH